MLEQLILKPVIISSNISKILFFLQKSLKNLIYNFENYIDPNDPTNYCFDVAIITAREKWTKKTIEKLNTVAGRVLNKWKNIYQTKKLIFIKIKEL